jgi:glutathione S-transferase
MQNLKLYTFKLCPFAHRVRIALAEKKLKAEHIEIDLKNKPADFLEISPTGRVPLLMHNGFKLWESAVILEYLDEAFPLIPLMPKDAKDRAIARLWIDFANSRLYAATHQLIFSKDEATRSRLVSEMIEGVRYLERQCSGKQNDGPYLLGRIFTLADVALFPWFEQVATLERFSAFKMPRECSAVLKWRDTVAMRPAVLACARSDDFYAEGYQSYLAA